MKQCARKLSAVLFLVCALTGFRSNQFGISESFSTDREEYMISLSRFQKKMNAFAALEESRTADTVEAELKRQIYGTFGVLCEGQGFTQNELLAIQRTLFTLPRVALMGFIKVYFKSVDEGFNRARYVEAQQAVILRVSEQSVGISEFSSLVLHETAHAMQAADSEAKLALAQRLGWSSVTDGFAFRSGSISFVLSEADIALGLAKPLAVDTRVFPSDYSQQGPDEMIAELVTAHVLTEWGMIDVERFDFSGYRNSLYHPTIAAYIHQFARA